MAAVNEGDAPWLTCAPDSSVSGRWVGTTRACSARSAVSSWSASPTPSPRTTAPSSTCRSSRTVDELVAAGSTSPSCRVPTTAHEQVAVQLAEAGVHVLIEKPVAPDTAGRAPHRRGVRRPRAGRRVSATSSATTRPCRRCAGGWPTASSGALYQIATRRQGPFPERIADVGVVLDLATHDVDLTAWVAKRPYATLSARTAHRSGLTARGPGRGRRDPLRRHGRQPPRQLALPAQGAGHGRDRRARHPRRRHHHRRPDVLLQRSRAGLLGHDGVVPRGGPGRRHPLRHPQARAPAGGARGLPRRRPRRGPPDRHDRGRDPHRRGRRGHAPGSRHRRDPDPLDPDRTDSLRGCPGSTWSAGAARRC